MRVFRLGRLGKYFSSVRTFMEDKYKISVPEGTLALMRLVLSLVVLVHCEYTLGM